MSEMSLAIAVRFKQPPIVRDATLLSKLKEIFGKDPDDLDEFDGVVESVEYDPKNHDGFTAHLIGDSILYVDYIVSEERECYGIDVNISKSQLEDIVKKAEALGIDASDYKIKVLYYYNGGCAGLSEVE